MLEDSAWAKRRVEQISFLDDRTVRRRISVDFRLLPSYAAWLDPQPRHWFVPLALLRKERPLVDFDLVDEEGRSLPLLTRPQAETIAAGALVEAAGTILKRAGRETGDDLIEKLERLVKCRRDEARAAFDDVFVSHRAADGRHHLSRDPLTLRLGKELSESYLVLTAIGSPDERRLIKFSFREQLEVRPTGIARALGWRAHPFRLPTPGVGMSGNFHCEVAAPENLEIVRARLSATARVDDGDGAERTLRVAADTDAEPAVHRQTPGERVHLQLTDLRPDHVGRLELKLRPSRPGLPGAATMLALGVSLLLSAGAVFHSRVAGSSESATGLLVAVPALIGAYIARPEHLLSKRLLRGVSWIAGAVGVFAFVAAAAAVIAKKGGNGQIVLYSWGALAILAWTATLVLGLGYVLPRFESRRPRGSSGDLPPDRW